MAAALLNHHTKNVAAAAPNGDLMNDACGAVVSCHGYTGTATESHNSLLHAQTVREGSMTMLPTTGGVVETDAALGEECMPNGEGDVPFGEFFFQNLPPASLVGNGDGDEIRHSAFDGFCFDDICGDGAWPTGDTVTGDAPRDDATGGDRQATSDSFHFLLSEIPTATGKMSEDVFHFEPSLAQSTDVAPAACEEQHQQQQQQQCTTCETKEIVEALHHHHHYHSRSGSSSKSGVAHGEGGSNHEDLKNAVTVQLNQPQLSSGINDTSTLALGVAPAAASAAAVVAPRVLREGVEELLRRADRILCEGKASNSVQQMPAGVSTTPGSEHDVSGTHTDAFFSAQVSHWLRRGAEVQEGALSAVSDLQLCLTQTLRLFTAHPGLSSALGPQYAGTSVVLTLPLVLPLLEALLGED